MIKKNIIITLITLSLFISACADNTQVQNEILSENQETSVISFESLAYDYSIATADLFKETVCQNIKQINTAEDIEFEITDVRLNDFEFIKDIGEYKIYRSTRSYMVSNSGLSYFPYNIVNGFIQDNNVPYYFIFSHDSNGWHVTGGFYYDLNPDSHDGSFDTAFIKWREKSFRGW